MCLNLMLSYLECSLRGWLLHLETDITGEGLEKCTAYHENKGVSFREQTEVCLNA